MPVSPAPGGTGGTIDWIWDDYTTARGDLQRIFQSPGPLRRDARALHGPIGGYHRRQQASILLPDDLCGFLRSVPTPGYAAHRLRRGQRNRKEIALQQVTAQPAELIYLPFLLHPFGQDGKPSLWAVSMMPPRTILPGSVLSLSTRLLSSFRPSIGNSSRS